MSHRSSQTTHLQLIYGAWRTQSIFEKGDLTGLRCADTTGSTTGSTAVGALKKLDQLKEAGFELTVSDARGLGFTLREIKEAGHTPEKVGESRERVRQQATVCRGQSADNRGSGCGTLQQWYGSRWWL